MVTIVSLAITAYVTTFVTRLGDECRHLCPGPVPRDVGQLAIDGVKPGPPRGWQSQCGARLCNKIGRRFGYPHRVEVAPAPDDIDDRSGDHRLPACEVFRCFSRANEAGRCVACERHHGNIPVRDVGRQVAVGLAAQVMNVGSLRQARGVDFTTGPTITRCQSGRSLATAASSSLSSRSSMTPKKPRRGRGISV